MSRRSRPVVQRHPRPAVPAAAAAAPGHAPAGRAGRPCAAVPDGVDPPGGHRRPYVDIPGEVIDIYKLWRPTPLIRARRLESCSTRPHGSTTSTRASPRRVAQAEHRRAAGLLQLGRGDQAAHDRDGAGQWGSALAFASAQYGLDCEIWMVRASYDQTAPPHDDADLGRDRAPVAVAATQADCPCWPPTGLAGSLGIAISEAVEAAAGPPRRVTRLGRCSTMCSCTRP